MATRRKIAKTGARLAALLVVAGTAVQGRAAAASPDTPAADYAECRAILESPPMTSYAQRIAEGGQENVRRIMLEQALAGIRCSDAQLIAFMTDHGMPFLESRAAPEFRETPRGGYDRILDFCVRSPTLLARLLHGRCGGVVRIMMIGDRVSYVIAHGSK